MAELAEQSAESAESLRVVATHRPEQPAAQPGANGNNGSIASCESSRRLINRELSWLDFNDRVLQIAADQDVPLLERVRFCSIYSNNLDEFFMVRVSGLLERADSGPSLVSMDGVTAHQTLVAIRERVLGSLKEQSALWQTDLQPRLAKAGVRIGKVCDCSEGEVADLEERFQRNIYPVLTPLAVGPGQPFPYISGLSLSLGLFVRDPSSGEERFARVKVPEGFPRFVTVGSEKIMVPLEEVIGHFLKFLFPGVDIVEKVVFRVSRDADLEVSDEAADLLEAVELQLNRRRFGDVVRLEVSDNVSQAMLDRLREAMDVAADQVYPVNGLLDLADLSQVADLDRPALKFKPWVPVTQPRQRVSSPAALFAQIRRADILVHHPYDSFSTSVEAFVKGASRDPGTIGIKTTVYRTSEDTPLVPALIRAAEEGKQSVCLVELKARFDEEHNIEWAKRLERAGVHVVHGFPNLKIHAKTILVVRREDDVLQRYVHIGTGNYHSRTARLYEDFGLFTADPDIAADISELFNYMTGFSKPSAFRKILVAPFGLKAAMKEQIKLVGKAAAEGQEARIRLKMNALVDPEVIEELYRASQEGAQIQIVCRGICALVPGVPGVSENITVRSILGRFLEHSRVYNFQAGDRSSFYLGSADLMQRNLDQRIEVVVPVEDGKIRQELATVLDICWADRAFVWELRSDGTWERIGGGKGKIRVGSQDLLMRRARARTVTKKSKPRRPGMDPG
ncbi:MAG: polyphosphate kinase 1 [Actinomycetota bacterium]